MKKTIPLLAILMVELCSTAPLFAATVRTATESFVTNKIAAAISQIPPPDYSTNNAALVATIEATAPAPGNYAAVSNAAMNALSRAEAEAGFTEWVVTPSEYDGKSLHIEWVRYEFDGLIFQGWAIVDSDGEERAARKDYPTATNLVWSADDTSIGAASATRTRLPTMADIPTAQINAATTTNAQQTAALHSLSNSVAGKQDKLPYPTNAIPYAAISGKPSLATVATSGSYNDLSNKPTIPTVPTAQINAATATNALQDAALAGKASTADTMLTERGFSEWNIAHTPLSAEVKSMFYDESADAEVNDYAVTIRGNDLYVGDYFAASLLLSSDGLSYAYSIGSGTAYNVWGPPGTTVATRELLSGYVLGSQTDKPLASLSSLTSLVSRVDAISAAVAGKQDKLPYPTNAIPYAAITGAPVVPSPSGLVAETSVLTRPASGDGVSLTIPSGGTISANIDVSGQCVFAHVTPSGNYTVDAGLTLVGYGSWPTNAFQAVFWRVGSSHYCNIIRED